MLPEPVLHILVIYLHEVFKGHGQIGLLCLQEVTLPLFRLSLQLKASFLFLFLGSGVIGVIEFAVPGFCLFVIICWHKNQSFLEKWVHFARDCDIIRLFSGIAQSLCGIMAAPVLAHWGGFVICG